MQAFSTSGLEDRVKQLAISSNPMAASTVQRYTVSVVLCMKLKGWQRSPQLVTSNISTPLLNFQLFFFFPIPPFLPIKPYPDLALS